jgi:hypothetical protein
MAAKHGRDARPGPLAALLRDPLVHFFVLGAAIFGLFAMVDDTPPPVAANLLVIEEDDARRLAAEFEATWRRPPTVAELDYMIGQTVREEVYVREALALGLDADDAVIRRRLQTKMEFLTESGAEALAPDEAALAALPDGAWAGPVETPLGRHLVRVTDRREARTPPPAEIREAVQRDWRASLTVELREARYAALLSRYEVVTPDAARVLAA